MASCARRAPNNRRSSPALFALAALAASTCRSATPPLAAPEPADERPSTLAYVPDEQWDDPARLAEPRLQFSARTEKDDGPWLVYSVRFDGTDVQRVVAPELLYANGAEWFKGKPERSPDRRWLACEVGNDDFDRLVLIDLKEKKVRTMFEGRGEGEGHIAWTPDSSSVFFYGEMKVWRYDVGPGTLNELPKIYSVGILVRAEGDEQRLVALRGGGSVDEYDLDGKKIRSVGGLMELPQGTFQRAISRDGKLIAVNRVDKLVVTRTDAAAPPVVERELSFTGPAFGPDGSSLYFFDGPALMKLEFSSGEPKQIALLPGGWPRLATLLPARSTP